MDKRRYKGKTTAGEYKLVFSGDEPSGDSGGAHITLAENADTITVWVRSNCADPNGKVGLSGVRLEDITAPRKIRAPQEIMRPELAEEKLLLNRAARFKEQAVTGGK